MTANVEAESPSVEDIRSSLAQEDLISDDKRANPHPFFEALLEHAPVIYNTRHKAWIISGYDQISRALKGDQFGTDRIGPYLESRIAPQDRDRFRRMFDLLGSMLLFRAAPVHTRLRGVVQKSFTPWRIEALREDTLRIAYELAGAIRQRLDAGETTVDLLEDFCIPLPGQVIAKMFGVPVEDGVRLKGWAEELGLFINGALGNPERNERVAVAMAEFEEYLRAQIARYREEGADNILSGLVAAADEGGKLDEDELIATCMLILDAGYKTVQYALANALLVLLGSPADWEALAEMEEVSQEAVEECLRFAAPGHYMIRRADADMDFDGHRIPAGARVYLATGAANRDSARFPDPQRFDIRRKIAPHMSFGGGAHFCLGAPLARMEIKSALTALLRTVPRLELAVPFESLQFQRVLILRAVDRLPVRVAKGAA